MQDYFDPNKLPIMESQWSIIASVVGIGALFIGGVFAIVKFFIKSNDSKSNKASVKDVKDSEITIDQKNE